MKIKSTYIDRFYLKAEEGIFYPYFKQNGTVSGRYGSDMQQLPKPKEDGEAAEIVVRYNKTGTILRDMVQMYCGRSFKSLTVKEIRNYSMYLEQYFDFVDNSKLYKPNELLKIFQDSDAQICLIDPFTGLDREMGYESNYRFLNQARQFVNQTQKTLYINTHPTSESGRNGNLYTDGEWKGHLKPPLKDHVEGGKAFLNRIDNMLVIHRLIKHEHMKFMTMVNVEKVKDQDTGGKITGLNNPIMCEYNSGLGFKIEFIDPLAKCIVTGKQIGRAHV